MSKKGLSRRQFVGATAAMVGASAVPAVMSAAPAVATPAITYPIPTPSWTPLDAKAAARLAIEIYRGKHANQSG